jgi:hypothetical protein
MCGLHEVGVLDVVAVVERFDFSHRISITKVPSCRGCTIGIRLLFQRVFNQGATNAQTSMFVCRLLHMATDR